MSELKEHSRLGFAGTLVLYSQYIIIAGLVLTALVLKLLAM